MFSIFKKGQRRPPPLSPVSCTHGNKSIKIKWPIRLRRQDKAPILWHLVDYGTYCKTILCRCYFLIEEGGNITGHLIFTNFFLANLFFNHKVFEFLGLKFHLTQTILTFWIKFVQKRYFLPITKKVNIAIEFNIFEIV